RPLPRRAHAAGGGASAAAGTAACSPPLNLDVGDPDGRLEGEHWSGRCRAGERQLSIRVDAVVARAHEVDRADPGVSVDHDGDVLRPRDDQLADPDTGVDRRGSGGQREATEVELEVADAVLVARVQGGDGRRSVVLSV